VNVKVKVLQHDEFLNKRRRSFYEKNKRKFIPRSLQSLQTAAKTETEKSAFIDKIRKSGNCKRIDLCMLVKLS